MKKVLVEVSELLPQVLEKDLQEGEEICPTCHGLGMVVADNPFGIENEKHPDGKLFPYKKQSLTFCPTCYNGVVRRCRYCGVIDRRYIDPTSHCNCVQARADRAKKLAEERGNIYRNATKIPLEEARKKYKMFYIEDYDEYVLADWFCDWLDEKEQDDEDFNLNKLMVYATSKVQIGFDAQSIIENACDDLYEDAICLIDRDGFKAMQDFFDKWCVEYGADTTTYYPNYSVAIIMPNVK